MKTIEVYRAQGTTDHDPTEPVTLVIKDPIPLPMGRMEVQLDELHQTFVTEANLVYAALKALPGGTLDALLVRMLEEKRSHHVVTWG
jgi:hypothetical protein